MQKNSLTSSQPDSDPGPGPQAWAGIDPEAWNGLAAATGPFVDWRFLNALDTSACTAPGSGWTPWPLILRDDQGRLRGAAPAWLKGHSHGEFVFDWAWARAAESGGLNWYPKLLVAAPFTPVTGPRLLSGSDPAVALALAEGLEARVERYGLSSAGVNFCTEDDARALSERGWLARFDWQFHWHNPGYRDFDDFLDRLKRKPRKNIRAERRRVHEAGWQFQMKSGLELTPADIDLITRCYQGTFALYGNLPSLNRDFFARAAEVFGSQFLACIASLDGQARAMAAFWRDERRLYGRYWGSLDDTRDVHFETCYYQGIEYCIRERIQCFEPGAQGEHKIRRGFLPQRTRSFHYIRHPGLRAGIARYLDSEAEALIQYRSQLDTLNPYGS